MTEKQKLELTWIGTKNRLELEPRVPPASAIGSL